MASCSHVDGCPLFPLFSMTSSLKIWRLNYCDDSFERCVRYRETLEGRTPPPNLLPNGKTLALATMRRSTSEP